MSSLVLVGGTGRLGQEIAVGLKTAPGFDAFRALVRPESTSKPEARRLQDELGYELVPVQDFTDVSALQRVLAGCRVLVSTLAKGQLWNLETALIDAASRAGVELFVPSQFGLDLDRFGADFEVYKTKADIVQRARRADLPVLRVTCGLFSDVVLDVLADPWEGTATLVQSEVTKPSKVSFTRRSDIGHVLAKALADPVYQDGGVLAMAGTTVHWKEALDMLANMMGKTFEYTVLSAEEAQARERELMDDFETKLDLRLKWKAFGLHVLTGIGSGRDGIDLSARARDYGHPMEPLEVTLRDVYIHDDDKKKA